MPMRLRPWGLSQVEGPPMNSGRFTKLYLQKTAITAADLLNDRVIPFYEIEGIEILRILTDRGTEYCGKVDKHEYQLYLALNDIEHTRPR